jgi:hypothetical protein
MTMLLADISDPELPSGTVTIVATHLDLRSRAEGRASCTD